MREIQQTNDDATNAFREESDERLYVLFAEQGNQEALAAFWPITREILALLQH